MTTPSKRELERRLRDVAQAHQRRQSRRQAHELIPEEEAEMQAHIEGIIDSLDDAERAALAEAQARIEREPDDAETDEFGLTAGEAAVWDALTGGVPRPGPSEPDSSPEVEPDE